ncbi:MAG: hypothetical protein IKT55_08255 [Clostridia bacterium]|nr:hypothetical protein [Clostridia bacterium]
MELSEYFITQCRAMGVFLRASSPNIKKLVSGKKGKDHVGVAATYSFDKFSLRIIYMEQGRKAYAQQSIWLTVTLDEEPLLPFSVYDVLAFAEPENFNCYTYTYVDSKELMQDCFGEINGLLIKLIPELSQILENGIEKNRLISSQKESINRYFGDNVLESSGMLGATGDKILNLMLKNYFDAQIECAVIGSQSLFYEGKTEKALKKLKKSKFRTQYHENLIKYLENGGAPLKESAVTKEASIKKGSNRHNGGIKGVLKYGGLSLLFILALSVLCIPVYYGLCEFVFRDSLYYMGLLENIVLFPAFCTLPGCAIAIRFINRNKKQKAKDSQKIHSPKLNSAALTFIKCFTIFAECVVILGFVTSLNSTTVFYENSFKYTEEDFPLSQSELNYDVVDYFAVVEGYKIEGEFIKDRHVVAVTTSKNKIDLYNSSYFSADDFKENAEDFLTEKGVEIKNVKTL